MTIQFGPISTLDAIEPIRLGLLQETVNPEREEPEVGMLLSPSFPTSILLDAVPGYWPGDPVAMEVVAALPCELTLPEGTEIDCQCTDCLECPDYPGCPTEGTPEIFSGPKVCTVGGNSCESNSDCDPTDPTDFCASEALLTADSPSGTFVFEPPVLPSVEVIPPVADPGDDVTVVAIDFPIDTGQPMTVLLGDVVIGSDPAPEFIAGKAYIPATIPADAVYGELELTVVLEGLATTADGSMILGVPPVVEEIAAPIDPVENDSVVEVYAEFVDNLDETHTAECDWGDGTITAATVTEPTESAPGVVADSHVYAGPGVYTVTLTVTDSKLNTTQQSFQFVVIYDPDDGFVTGGGWIDNFGGFALRQ